MAPPERAFPISELENRVHTHTVNLYEKNRKLGKDFDLRNCDLFELVQYSCTTPQQQAEKVVKDPTKASVECFPFVRLFRRCGEGAKAFHVETTAWEGEHAWRPLVKEEKMEAINTSKQDSFATYTDGYFWSKNNNDAGVSHYPSERPRSAR